jgi:hypothetical protein
VEDKKRLLNFELRDFDTLRDVKCKLASRINKEPCEIVFYNADE